MIQVIQFCVLLICYSLLLLNSEAYAADKNFLPCEKLIQRKEMLPVLARLDDRPYPFYIDELVTPNLLSTDAPYPKEKYSRRLGSFEDIKVDMRDMLARFDGCLSLTPWDLLVIDNANGTNFIGIYYYNLRKVDATIYPLMPEERLLSGNQAVVKTFSIAPDSTGILLSSNWLNHGESLRGYNLLQIFHSIPTQNFSKSTAYATHDLIFWGNNFGCANRDVQPCGDPEGMLAIHQGNGKIHKMKFGRLTANAAFINVSQKNNRLPILKFKVTSPCGKHIVEFIFGGNGSFTPKGLPTTQKIKNKACYIE